MKTVKISAILLTGVFLLPAILLYLKVNEGIAVGIAASILVVGLGVLAGSRGGC